MTEISIPGVDGTEPVGFFAGLGIARIISAMCPAVRLRWKPDGARSIACIDPGDPGLDLETIGTTLADTLQSLGKEEAMGLTLGYDTIDIPREEFRAALADAVSRWREQAIRRRDGADVDYAVEPFIAPAVLGALASDLARPTDSNQTNVVKTPLSFSNGHSNQNLLKDFRVAAGLSTHQQIHGTIHGGAPLHQVPSLNWHHSDHRPAAYRWSDPAFDKPKSDPGINALAFIGLSFFPVIPTPDAQVTGIDRTGRWWEFSWPLWTPFLSTDRIMSLLAQDNWYRSCETTGIHAVRSCTVIRVGTKSTRPLFARSRRVR